MESQDVPESEPAMQQESEPAMQQEALERFGGQWRAARAKADVAPGRPAGVVGPAVFKQMQERPGMLREIAIEARRIASSIATTVA